MISEKPARSLSGEIGFHGDSCSVRQWQLVGFVFEDASSIHEEEFSGDALLRSMLGCKVKEVIFGVLCFGRMWKFCFERGCRFTFGRERERLVVAGFSASPITSIGTRRTLHHEESKLLAGTGRSGSTLVVLFYSSSKAAMFASSMRCSKQSPKIDN
jgi:hypothetical protein